MSLNKAPWILQQIVEKRYIICVTLSVSSVEIASVLLLSVNCNTSIPEYTGSQPDQAPAAAVNHVTHRAHGRGVAAPSDVTAPTAAAIVAAAAT